MSKRSPTQGTQAFDSLTMTRRRGKRSIRPEFVPELVAWLLTQAASYERIRNSLSARAQWTSDASLAGLRDYCDSAIKTIEALILASDKQFERCYWNEAACQVAETMGIEYNEPIPDEWEIREGQLLLKRKEDE